MEPLKWHEHIKANWRDDPGAPDARESIKLEVQAMQMDWTLPQCSVCSTHMYANLLHDGKCSDCK